MVTIKATGVTVIVGESVSVAIVTFLENVENTKIKILVTFLCAPSLPSLSVSFSVSELGELRLDSLVIHRTKLGLALHLY